MTEAHSTVSSACTWVGRSPASLQRGKDGNRALSIGCTREGHCLIKDGRHREGKSDPVHRLGWGGHHLITSGGAEIKSSNHRLLRCKERMLLPYFRAEEEVKSFAHRNLQGKGTTLLMLGSHENQRPTHRLCWREVSPCNCWWSRSQSPPYRLC